MEVEPRAAGQPGLDGWGLVGRGVVEHHVEVEIVGHGHVDLGVELLELLGAAAAGGSDDLTCRHVERGGQVGDPVALVVVGATLHLPGSHGQDGLGPVESLDSGLLVDTDHDGVLGRVQVDAHDVTDLLDEERVLGELKRVGRPRYEPEGPPYTGNRRLAHTCRSRHVPRRPVGGACRLLDQRLHDQGLDVVVPELAGHTRPRFVVQPVETLDGESPPPLADRGRVPSQPHRHLGVAESLGALQDDPAAKSKGLLTLRPSGSPFERLPLVLAQHHLDRCRSMSPHVAYNRR